MTRSIRQRLLTWLLSGVLVSGIAATAAVYVQTRDEVDEVFDRQIKQIALSLKTQDDLSAKPADTTEEAEDRIEVSAWDRTGRPVLGVARGRSAPTGGLDGFRMQLRDGEPWRVYVATGAGGTVETGQPIAARTQIAVSMVAQILLPIGLFILALIALVLFAVRQGLRPLEEMAELLAARSGIALDPIGVGDHPKEVVPFILALDGLLARLRHESVKQKQFVADAAHELRTPIQALRLQLELAEGAPNEDERHAAMARLRGGIDRLSHLVHQLLIMARVDPHVITASLQPVDLSQIAIAVIGELWPLAKAKDIDFGSTINESALVNGNAEALRTMLTNIVDNAVRYTPPGGRVDVNVRRTAQNVELEVVDTGSGISPDKRARVFDRFYRGDSDNIAGSGLGLAIVRSLADRHQARILLEDGPNGRGLRFRVSLEAISYSCACT